MKRLWRGRLALVLAMIMCMLQWTAVFASENGTGEYPAGETVISEAVSGEDAVEETGETKVSEDGYEQDETEKLPESVSDNTKADDIEAGESKAGDEEFLLSEDEAGEAAGSGEDPEEAAGEEPVAGLEDYTYTKDDEKHIVTLTAYNGNAASITVPSKASVNGIEYKVTVFADDTRSKSIWAGHDELKSISFDEGFEAPENCRGFFANCTGVESIDLTNFDTSKVIDMDYMFDGCRSLSSLNISSLVTSKVKDMRSMFSNCGKLTRLDFDPAKFDTYYVVDMSGMFSYCKGLTSLDVSGFKTSEVTDMGGMFSGCESLSSLDLANFETSRVTNMTTMFTDCSKLGTLNISSLNTSSVVGMRRMFEGCASLSSLDLRNFDTRAVTEMDGMFSGCENLESLDLSSFVLSGGLSMENSTFYSGMFYNTLKLQTIKTPVTRDFTGDIDLFARYSGGGYENIDKMPTGLSESITLTRSSVIPVTSLKLYYYGNPVEEIETFVGPYGTNTFWAQIEPENATDQRLEWSSTDESVARYAEGSGLQRYKPGTAVITVRSKGHPAISASCRVTVTDGTTPIVPPVEPEEKAKYTVKFLSGNVLFDSQTVTDGETATEPAQKPEKEGYSFIGWAMGSTLYNFATPVHSDLTLNAKFVDAAGGSASENSGSGMDPVAKVTKDGTIYLVKNQSYTLGGSGWSLKNGTGIVTVSEKNGKVTGKMKGTAEVSNEDGTATYKVVVAEPAFEQESKKISGILVGSVTTLKFALNAPDGADQGNYGITWYSSNPKVAVVNDGTVTALAKGNVSIKAYVGGRGYTSKLSVTDTCKAPGKQKEIKELLEFNMNPLQSFNLKYDTPVFRIKNAEWTGDGMSAISKNGTVTGYKNSVVSITNKGKIKAIGNGSTQITGYDGSSRVNIKINVVNVPAKESIYLNRGQKPAVKFANVKNANADWWKSSDESVFTVSKKGKLNGKKFGAGEVSCSYNGFVFTSRVYVEEPELETDDSLKKSGTGYTLEMNEGTIYNRVKLKNTYQTVNFVSSRPAEVFIDENGIVYARKKGKKKVNITGSVNGKKIKISVSVK